MDYHTTEEWRIVASYDKAGQMVAQFYHNGSHRSFVESNLCGAAIGRGGVERSGNIVVTVTREDGEGHLNIYELPDSVEGLVGEGTRLCEKLAKVLSTEIPGKFRTIFRDESLQINEPIHVSTLYSRILSPAMTC